MNQNELHDFLNQYTANELLYLKDPNYLSNHYKYLIQKKKKNLEYYIFEFKSVLKGNTIAIHKDDRFTFLHPHTHKVIELNYIYSGKCTYFINGEKKILHAGDLCILDTNVIHSATPTGCEDIIINIAMTKAYFSSGFFSHLPRHGLIANFLFHAAFSAQSHNAYLILRNKDSSKIHMIIQSLCCEFFDQTIGSKEVIDAYMIILFTEMLRLITQLHDIEIADSSHSNQLIDILDYIEDHYLNCSLAEISKQFNYNSNYLSSLLKKKTGKSFTELKLMQQMTFVSFHLINSKKSIHEIAGEAGFSNHGFFYQKFQNHFKMSPKHYREMYRVPLLEPVTKKETTALKT